MSKLPKEIQKQLKSFVSKTTDEALDLVVNLSGKYLDEMRRKKLKKASEREMGMKIEQAIAKAFEIGVTLRQMYQQNRLEDISLKEKFYLLTDTIMKPLLPDIPKKVHAMDYLFQTCEELADVRFDFVYLNDTKYLEYLKSWENLVKKLKEKNKIGKLWAVLWEFKDSKDAYTLVQATLQRLFNYYRFLQQDFLAIRKRQLDKYLQIYSELSGQYEKLISLIAISIELLLTDVTPKYEDIRKKRLYENMRFVEKRGWEIFVSGFNRNLRNALAHETYKVDLVKGTVDFYDANKTITLTFEEAQKETRELSALLLILPHMFISTFYLAIMSLKQMLDDLPT